MHFTVPDEFAVVALDVHDANTRFGILPPGERDVVEDDVCETRETFILSRITRLSRKWAIVVMYEAGRLGYWLFRKLKAKGIHCIVIDPGTIPERRRGQSKTDRLDVQRMARLARANVLTAVSVPDEATQGLRDLLRCYQALSKTVTAMKNRITSTLARYNFRCAYTKTPFTLKYRAWLSQEVKLPTDDAQYALDSLYGLLIQAESQLEQARARIVEKARCSQYAKACEYLMVIHGVGPMLSLGFLTSMQTPHRFPNAGSIMGYYGLVSDVCESDGKSLKHSRSTRRGDKLTRWLLVQAAWSYFGSAKPTKKKMQALAQLPPWLRERILKMHQRLYGRFRNLVFHKRILPVKAAVAVAREMAGWLWAISLELEEHGLVSFAPAEELLPKKAA